MIVPEIIKKTSDTFQKDVEGRIERKVLFYTPEWSFEDKDDFGVGLSSIFAYMSEFAIKRLNDAPNRHFLTFLETINASLLPARSARAILKFTLSKGTPENVLIPAPTQASASGPDGKPVIFETEKNIVATPANLSWAFSVMNDQIFDNTLSIDGSDLTQFFYGYNMQEHILYIGDKNLFNVKKANIIIYMQGTDLPNLGNQDLVAWEYASEVKEMLGDKEITKIIWVSFKSQQWQKSGFLILEKDTDKQPVGITEINGLKSRWIRCRVNDLKPLFRWNDDSPMFKEFVNAIFGTVSIENLNRTDDGRTISSGNNSLSLKFNDEKTRAFLMFNNIEIGEYNVKIENGDINIYKYDPKIKKVRNIQISNLTISVSPGLEKIQSVKLVQGIGDLYYELLAEPANIKLEKIDTIDKLLKLTPVKLAERLGCSKTRAINILEAAHKAFYDKTGFETQDGTPEGIDADLAFCNDVPVDPAKEILPFGSKPQVFATFYLASADAFSKKGYKVIINFDLILPGIPIDNNNMPVVSWEYWDGNGWSLMNFSEKPNNLTSKEEHTITIENMPEVKTVAVNGKESYWIRLRLESGNYGKEYELIIGTILFSWEDIQKDEKDNVDLKGLKEFLKQKFSIGWVINATIEKIDDNTLKISYNHNSLNLIRNIEKTKVNLYIDDCRIDDCRTDEFIANFLNGKLKYIGTNVIKGSYHPPKISNLKIKFEQSARKGEKPEYISTLNNLTTDFQWKKIDKPFDNFKPFNSLSETDLQAVYFGFDKPLKNGPISLFIQLSEALLPEDFYPKVKWQMLYGGAVETWKELDFMDETGGFKKSGILQFSFQEKMKKAGLFGVNDMFWVRAVVTGDLFNTGKAVLQSPLTSMITTGAKSLIKQCGNGNNVFGESFTKEEPVKLPPDVLGFYLNSSWAVQSKTINDEIIGSGTGEANQTFQLLNAPVINEEIWVDEAKILYESERKALSQDPARFLEKKDSEGNVTEFWVKWDDVDDFIDSKGSDRHYLLDTTAGEIRFGDGESGMVPPIGDNNISATYCTGGGKSGNLDVKAISKLQSAVAFVDKVSNPVASDGGSDIEKIDMLIKRAPYVLKHRNRAVALTDYELLAKEASRKVARVKVLPNFDEIGKFRTGTVTVTIVPESLDPMPSPSPELKRAVKQYISGKSPNIAELYVIKPSYVKVSIRAQIITREIDALPVIEKEAKTAMADFLHPLKGGVGGQGWSFGASPCISDIYSILEKIENVYQVNLVVIRLEDESGNLTRELTNTSDSIRLQDYALPYSGEHDIKVIWKGKG